MFGTVYAKINRNKVKNVLNEHKNATLRTTFYLQALQPLHKDDSPLNLFSTISLILS